ncbi:telomere repeats-binding bouquet formation protein 2 [Chanos chanos]|uniref:Telomere repeats-binding bouquet formation protein 2 n=1 Tax=Chanos chanos TaxID=29144 RepID=A0A6J2X0D1_CHACN|nr:telomere repeats-binding bouquet formation protein 2 [Chanos chanos]
MFKKKTAWFSGSVRRGIRSFWVSEGGLISRWKSADYLFSDDATCHDTKRIFDTDDYARDRVTVFHSAFLSACQVRNSVKSVPIGHYVLPPFSVQKELKAVIGRFIWEHDKSQQGEQREGSVCCEGQHYPVNNMVSGYVCISQLRKYSGELNDLHPSYLHYSVSQSCRRRFCSE